MRGKQRVFPIMRLQPSALIASDCIAGGLKKRVGSKPYHPRIGSRTPFEAPRVTCGPQTAFKRQGHITWSSQAVEHSEVGRVAQRFCGGGGGGGFGRGGGPGGGPGGFGMLSIDISIRGDLRLFQSGSVLLVADVLHPIDDSSHQGLLNGNVRHPCSRRCAMPMLLTR
jgi:hypothetical protein